MKLRNIFFGMIFAAFTFCAASQELNNLEIKSLDQFCFTNQESAFVLEIPGVRPSEVQNEMPGLPAGVSFVSSRRTEFYSDAGEAGISVELWLNFKSAGSYSIPPMPVRIKGRRYSIKFQPVQVFENPKTISPKLILEFDDGTLIDDSKQQSFTFTAGQPVRFKLYVQYAMQIQQFGWNLPKNSLFTELKRYDITKAETRGSSFSPDKVPVAYFEWIPLRASTVSLPDIRLRVTAYNGRAADLLVPDAVVKIIDDKTLENDASLQNEANDVFAYAFTKDESGVNDSELEEASPEVYKKIAELRSMEKHSFGFSGKIRKERVEYEAKIGIKDEQSEVPVNLFFVSLSLFTVCLIMGAFLFILRKKTGGIIFTCLASVFAFSSVFMGVAGCEKYGIVTGGYINPVPEDSALTSSVVAGGNRVHILREAGLWYYIEYSEKGGWIKKEYIIPID